MKKAEMEKLCGGSEALLRLCRGQGFCAAHAEVVFEGRVFCFTGRSAHAARAELEREVTTRGGAVTPRVTQRTDYLVVGGMGSSTWAHGSYGDKIHAVARVRAHGGRITVVSEEDFWRALIRSA